MGEHKGSIGEMKGLARTIASERGFTLVELSMVIAVILILAAIGIPKFAGVTDSADKQAARGDLKQAWSKAKANIAGVPDMQAASSYVTGNGVTVDEGKSSINQLVIVKSFSGGVCEMTITSGGQESYGRDC